MEYTKGLLQNKLQSWTGKQWYHQRFDGCPYFIHFIAEAEIITHEDRKKDADFTVHYCFFSEGKADWYIEIEDMKKVYTAILNQGKTDPNISTTLIQEWQADETLFYKKCLEVNNTDLTKLTNKELIKLHDDFAQITLNRNSSSSLIDGFALGTDEIIADKIKGVYEKSELKENMRFTEVFSTLTAPIHLSFINDAEVELLKIALEVKKDSSQRGKLLEEHQKKFFWTHNNYVDAHILDVEYFGKELDKILSLEIDIESEINKIKETPQISKEKKGELMKSLELNDELKLLIKISEDFTRWQDERKKATFWTIHYCSLILEEIGKRVDVSLDEIKYMTCREVSNIFDNKPDRSVLQERKKSSAFYWDKEGHEAVYGKEVEKVKKTILEETDLSQVDDFRGLTACLGIKIGKVKVVKSVKEIDKVKEGDIIVAVMTRPDYVPAMKKAAAIVTDEGGVTSHAAIVARELNIPCVIGTKIATKVLKDGDEIEVDANHGIVKILKKA